MMTHHALKVIGKHCMLKSVSATVYAGGDLQNDDCTSFCGSMRRMAKKEGVELCVAGKMRHVRGALVMAAADFIAAGTNHD